MTQLPHPFGRHAGPMNPNPAQHDRLEIPPSLLWCAVCNGFQPRKGGKLRPFFVCAGCRKGARK